MMFFALFAVFLAACRAGEYSEQLEQLSSIWKVQQEAIFGIASDEILDVAPTTRSRRSSSFRLQDAQPGFAAVSFYQLTPNCSGGNADYNFGYLANVCLVSHPSTSSKPLKSYYFSCLNDGKFTTSSFASDDCDEDTLITSLPANGTCQISGTSSFNISCLDLTVDFHKKFILTQYFADSNCTDMYAFSGIQDTNCLQVSSFSYYYHYPNVSAHFGKVCAGSAVITAPVPGSSTADTCRANGVDDDATFNGAFISLGLTATFHAKNIPESPNHKIDDGWTPLSPGAIVVIIISALFFVGVVCAAVYFTVYKKDLVVKPDAAVVYEFTPARAIEQ